MAFARQQGGTASAAVTFKQRAGTTLGDAAQPSTSATMAPLNSYPKNCIFMATDTDRWQSRKLLASGPELRLMHEKNLQKITLYSWNWNR